MNAKGDRIELPIEKSGRQVWNRAERGKNIGNCTFRMQIRAYRSPPPHFLSWALFVEASDHPFIQRLIRFLESLYLQGRDAAENKRGVP